mgnify:CR=1 FL=1
MAMSDRPVIDLSARIRLALVVSTVVFGLVLLRLWYMQILKGSYYREKSENNRLRTIYTRAPRGVIYDRHGVVLVRDRPAFNIELVEEDAIDKQHTLKALAQVLQIDLKKILSNIGVQERKRTKFEPLIILKDVDRQIVARVAAKRHMLPGITITVAPARSYLFKDFAAHTIGHIREISAEQLASSDYSDYRPADLIGQSGVERVQENMLRGKRGLRKVVVNARGVRISDAYFRSEEPGHGVTLSIDYALQAAADEALLGKSGAIVVMRADNGEILALSSAPRFDPNMFVGELDPASWASLSQSTERPLSNRILQGTYAPGSVYKIVTAAAALMEGVTDPNEIVDCNGAFKVGKGRPFHCHKLQGHGPVNLVQALKQSCNVYFYVMGQRLGVDRMHDYALKFGFGSKTGLALGAEATGLVPSTSWKKSFFSNPEDQVWYPGETPSVSIGQGAVTVTPIQVAKAFAAVVNGGMLVTPVVIKNIKSVSGGFYDDSFVQQGGEPSGLDLVTLEHIKQGLIAVINEKGGTGANAKISEAFNVQAGGKTGTAQQLSSKNNGQRENNAWFAGFAPADQPEIVVVVLMEAGGKGGAVAAPIAKRLMEIYFGVSRQTAL